MKEFVPQHSIVRRIWGNPDVILLIFAGSAAEFALNRAVDWLFFTNKLPMDPIGRLFSTVRYAQNIIFVDEATAQHSINHIAAIHKSLERQRKQRIPDWAYRDVLYMLVDYPERAYRLLYRPLTTSEQQEIYAVVSRIGTGLQIPNLPATYTEWQLDRQRHLDRDLALSQYTFDLFKQYRLHLGAMRYDLLLQVQALLVPKQVRELLHLYRNPLISFAIKFYQLIDLLGLRSLIQHALLPPNYLNDIRQLERTETA